MQRSFHWSLGLALALLIGGELGPDANAQGARPPTAEDLVSLRNAEDVQMAPSGNRVAFTVNEPPPEGKPRAEPSPSIWIVATEGENDPRRVTPADSAVYAPRWGPGGQTLAFLMKDADGEWQIFRQSVDGNTPEQVTRLDGGVGWSLAWSPDGARIAFTASDSTEAAKARGGDPIIVGSTDAYTHLWTVPAEGGEATRVTTGSWNVEALTWAPDGDRLALVASDLLEEGNALLTVRRSGTVLDTLSRRAVDPGTRDQFLDWSPDGETILFGYTPPDDGSHQIALVPAEGGKERHLLKGYDGTLMRAVWLPDSQHLLAQSFEKVRSHLLRIDTKTEEVTTLTDLFASYPHYSASADGETVAYLGQSRDAPANVWIYEEDAENRRITNLNPQVEEWTLGEVREVRWENEKDGTTLYGVLVTPPGGTLERPYPTVVHVHGGPHFHWGLGWLGWRGWAQWLAPRDYAVFLPNPRGSTGRSWDFARSIHHQLGGPDGRDVLAGVDALVERGIADSSRLYVGGWSYGGFLTAWLITQTDRFRAAVVGAGISNYYSLAGASGLGAYWSDHYFPAFPHRRPHAYWNVSPVTHLRRVTTPTLILHGQDDPKISSNQGRELYNGLQRVGVESELVIYPREGHGIDEHAHQVDLLQRVLDWYDEH